MKWVELRTDRQSVKEHLKKEGHGWLWTEVWAVFATVPTSQYRRPFFIRLPVPIGHLVQTLGVIKVDTNHV